MPPILWIVHLHTPGLHRGEHVLKHHAGLAATRVVAIDGDDIAIDLVYALRAGVSESPRRHLIFEIGHLARAQRKIVGGEIHYYVARAVRDVFAFLARLQ